jgi:hypothetical protein
MGSAGGAVGAGSGAPAQAHSIKAKTDAICLILRQCSRSKLFCVKVKSMTRRCANCEEERCFLYALMRSAM